MTEAIRKLNDLSDVILSAGECGELEKLEADLLVTA
jgi:hypothetical protein